MLQVANLYGKGADKLSFDGRVEFARNHLHEIFDSADNPFTGSGYAHIALNCITLHSCIKLLLCTPCENTMSALVGQLKFASAGADLGYQVRYNHALQCLCFVCLLHCMAAVDRQDLSRMYLAHYELESDFYYYINYIVISIIIIIIIIIVILINTIVFIAVIIIVM